jgi:hypothetical protein
MKTKQLAGVLFLTSVIAFSAGISGLRETPILAFILLLIGIVSGGLAGMFYAISK